jgi:hypothetical protein
MRAGREGREGGERTRAQSGALGSDPATYSRSSWGFALIAFPREAGRNRGAPHGQWDGITSDDHGRAPAHAARKWKFHNWSVHRRGPHSQLDAAINLKHQRMAEAKKINGSKAKEPYQARAGTRWKVREGAKNVFVCLVDADITTADLQRPGFFEFVSKDLRRRDDIEVHTIDGRKRWLLQVLDAGIGWAQVHVLEEYQLPEVTQVDRDVLEGFELCKDGETNWWFAVRKLDRQAMFKNEQIKSKNELVVRIQSDATVRQQQR